MANTERAPVFNYPLSTNHYPLIIKDRLRPLRGVETLSLKSPVYSSARRCQWSRSQRV